jgi:DNA polymerase I-like protein with 3'-5' exonuclease and polymerase domains
MSDEKQEIVEQEEKKEEPKGTDWVDDAEWGSQKAKARFTRVYGHLKNTERGMTALQEHNRALTSKLEELIAKQETSEVNTRVGQIEAALAAATEKGDARAQAQLQVLLTKELQPKPKTTLSLPEIQTPNVDVSEAMEWESEVDASGNFLRPWAQQTHPKYQEVHNLTKQLIGDPSFGNDVPKILAEIDKRMGTQKKRAPGPGALSSGTRPSTTSTKLSDDELRVAKNMGITPQDYAKQKQLLGAS